LARVVLPEQHRTAAHSPRRWQRSPRRPSRASALPGRPHVCNSCRRKPSAKKTAREP